MDKIVINGSTLKGSPIGCGPLVGPFRAGEVCNVFSGFHPELLTVFPFGELEDGIAQFMVKIIQVDKPSRILECLTL